MKPGDPQSVRNLFNAVAPNYDNLNDLFSFGLHRLWKRQLLNWVRPMPGENWLDLCCGTGDLALSLAHLVGPGGTVIGIDSALQPLDLAKRRAAKKTLLSLSWLKDDVLATSLPSNYFDGAVMAYGLRNLAQPAAGLKEVRRLLKKGARAGILDFNSLPNGSLKADFQKFYLRKLVVPIAAKFGLRDEYAYLEQSLRVFPNGSTQKRLASEAGFELVSYRQLACGQMGALLLTA